MRLAVQLIAGGWAVAGTCRTKARRQALHERGIEAYLFDRTTCLDRAALAGTTHLLLSVPPDERGDPVFDSMEGDIARLSGLRWVGYLSTTGVYGDRGGAWVSEDDALAPGNRRSRRRVRAETAWLDLWRDHRVPVHVFRLAGIYGPGRSALDQLRAGAARRIVKPGHVFSRIHVDDVVQTLIASMARPAPGAVYNLGDDEPASNADVVAFAATLLGVAPPPETPIEKADLPALAAGFYSESRRVRNDRIKRELGVVLRRPTYRDGLRAILESGN